MDRTIDRRSFLRTLAGATGAAALSVGCASRPTVSRIIDTHTHFYDPTRGQGVPWPQKGSFLDRPVLPPDWQRVAAPHGIRETVVVEASAWTQDNDWILRLADEHPCIVGFIGNLRPADGTFAGHLRRLAAHPLFRGIRIPASKLSTDLSDPVFARHLGLLADFGLAVDINGLGDFPGAVRLARDFPGLRIVVDHVGNVRDPAAPDVAWREGMRRLGAETNVYCKLSGLVEPVKTPHGEAPTNVAYYRPTLDHVTASFGPTRVFYGSNWPVSDKGALYADVFGLVADYYADRTAEDRERFFWRNSLEAYRWISRGA